jgi:hypothetical protein
MEEWMMPVRFGEMYALTGGNPWKIQKRSQQLVSKAAYSVSAGYSGKPDELVVTNQDAVDFWQTRHQDDPAALQAALQKRHERLLGLGAPGILGKFMHQRALDGKNGPIIIEKYH